MFNIFKKKTKGTETVIKIKGMHCTSCGLNIDNILEDLGGVLSSSTSYARSEVKIEFDPEKISLGEIKKEIEKMGYETLY